ncbi:hypothetical protein [Streptomyces aurantiogriseus]|uniref:Uncharacterized protein n=1 Tax=Streptomyces aurantiogriseus TaxID=66870 RepID=A0A918CFH1_9ACTN|nr:hypothetical protein [Streptomyces aurantiogriseus]GGR20404.1 hypothetical protein GCM10010251_40250 [Streptomyces aurantiogriseus]
MTSPQSQPQTPQEPPQARGETTQTERAETGTTRPEATRTAPPVAPTEQQAPMERREEEARGHEGPMGGKVVHLHTAHPRVSIPYVTPGDMFTGARAATSKLPSPRKLAYYGLLGGMTVAGVLEWPVAVAVGAATEVITREQASRKRAEQEEQRRQAGAEPQGRTTEPARPSQTAMA